VTRQARLSSSPCLALLHVMRIHCGRVRIVQADQRVQE
jgi:hypothetical protein